jgi:hypothetical protein
MEKWANGGPAAGSRAGLGRTKMAFSVEFFAMRTSNEKFLGQVVHLVEFADLWDPILDLDVW